MTEYLTACGKTYHLISLLGRGKGGYSYLAECDGRKVVLKQIHHEPCDYYTFGNKIEAECRDYQRLKDAGIRIPAMLAADIEAERIVKEYIEGDTVFDCVRDGISVEPYLRQVREMAAQAMAAGLNIDYFPTNFVVCGGLIWYVDYECNGYMDEWNFENWGIKYWSRTQAFEEYLRQRRDQDMIRKQEDLVLYIHGKGGCAAECEHYRPLFPNCDVFGLDYRTFTPWETGAEIRAAIEKLKENYDNIILIANSIGAFFSMNAGIDSLIRRAYFISPIVDMERLIRDMMLWSNVTEEELQAKGVIRTDFGEDLSWEYLRYVREHPVRWSVPTKILYGERDSLTGIETIHAFAEKHDASLTIMENGEHWFHTDEQMRFLDDWIKE